jgi:hypothetical protein
MYKAHDARARNLSWFDIFPFVFIDVNEDGEAKECCLGTSTIKFGETKEDLSDHRRRKKLKV